MLETILVPTDGSANGSEAVKVAADLAGKYGARLVVLHVLTEEVPEALLHAAQVEHVGEASGEKPGRLAAYPGEVMARQPLKGTDRLPQEVLDYVSKQVLEQAEALAKESGASKIVTEADAGDPVEVILDTAKQVKANLIVLGRRGLGPIKRLLMGSVSSKVGQLADCSTLVVRH